MIWSAFAAVAGKSIVAPYFPGHNVLYLCFIMYYDGISHCGWYFPTCVVILRHVSIAKLPRCRSSTTVEF